MVQRRVRGEALRDPYDLAAEPLELALDRLVADRAVSPKTCQEAGIGTTYGTAQPRNARAENSIVLIACSPCVPPAALIRPITLSCRYGGSRRPRTCSQSSAFLNAPEIVPW